MIQPKAMNGRNFRRSAAGSGNPIYFASSGLTNELLRIGQHP
jgi:hypothetical protein